MRDLPAPTPSAQQALARMYAQRVPSRPKQIGRMPEQQVDQPWYKDAANALGSAYEWLRDNRVQTVTGGVGGPIQTEVATPVEQAVEPLRVAGRRVVGDITAIPGVGADSPSYTAQEFRDENPWVAALKTALDYGSIAALGAQGVGATRNAIRPQYGVHVSPTGGLTEISPRSVGATQAAAADAKVGSTYMWDARSPRLLNEVFDNPQMAGIAGMGETPTVYVTRARGQVFQDANALNSPAIRVAGPQQVLGEVPYTREALLNFLESQGIRPRGATADRLAQFARGLSPTVRADVANRPFQMAEERLRAAIRIGRENPNSQWGALAGLDETADIGTLLNSPEARGFFDNFVEMSGGTRGTYPAMSPQSALAEEMAARAMDRAELLRFVQEVRNAGFSANEFPKEFRAVSDYFNQNFPQYQSELRSPGAWPEARPNISLIDSLFERSGGLQRPTILYRGVKNSNFIPMEYRQILKNLKVGDVLEEPGYMSTSIDREMAAGFSDDGLIFEIEAPAGSKVISPLMNDELLRPYADPERELLLPRNTKLQIVAIDGNTIRARIVG